MFGRDADLSRLIEAVSSGTPLTSLVGPTGVGKSRLARELVSAHGALWIDLTCAGDVPAIALRVAGALGIEPGTGRSSLDQQLAVLARGLRAVGAGVVVLDGVEQIAAEIATLTTAWREAAPGLGIVVTSREPLRVADEVVLAVEPLAPDAAVDMLCARITELRGVEPTPAEREAAPRIADALDRLPLAIELAAGRCRALSLLEVERRIADGRLELAASSRGADPRHRSLRAAIGHSWNLLDEPCQQALAACSLFSGPFCADDADAVLGEPAVEIIEELCNRSLLSRRDDGRFELLRCIREFAADKLPARPSNDEDGGVRERFVRGCTERGEHLADELDGPHDAEASLLLAELLPDLIAAQRLAEAMWPSLAARAGLAACALLLVRGPAEATSEVVDRCESCAAGAGDPILAARSLIARGRSLLAQGFLDAARSAIEGALTPLPPPEIEGEARRVLGIVHREAARVADAERELSRALELGRDLARPALIGFSLHGLGMLARDQGDGTRAEQIARQALAVAQRLGNQRLLGHAVSQLGVLALEAGHRDQARELARSALAVQRRLGNRRLEGKALANLAQIELDAGELDAAAHLFEAALAIHRRVGDGRGEAIALGNLGIVNVERGALVAARTLLDQSIAAALELDPRIAAYFDGWYAAVDALSGHIARATARFDRACGELARLRAPELTTTVRVLAGLVPVARARIAADEGDPASGPALADALPPPGADLPSDAAIASRVVRAAVARLDPTVQARAFPDHELVVAGSGTWFRPPRGTPVDIRGRLPLRRLLAGLVAQHRRAPGDALSTLELTELGWPGAGVDASAGAVRVRVALATLRKKGLREVLIHRTDGYLIDPAVTVRCLDDVNAT